MKLDHFIGRPVEAVRSKKDNTGYAIYLEGDVRVGISGQKPDGLNGLVLLKVTPSEGFAGELTTLLFGHTSEEGPINTIEIMTPTADYSLYTPDHEDEIFPGREVEQEDTLPPDPSAERVADKPLQASQTDAVAYAEGEGGN